jgi:hypothetical protein
VYTLKKNNKKIRTKGKAVYRPASALRLKTAILLKLAALPLTQRLP